jgi:hypothetical protein
MLKVGVPLVRFGAPLQQSKTQAYIDIAHQCRYSLPPRKLTRAIQT